MPSYEQCNNNNYEKLQELVPNFKIPMAMRNFFFERYGQYVTRPHKSSPALAWILQLVSFYQALPPNFACTSVLAHKYFIY